MSSIGPSQGSASDLIKEVQSTVKQCLQALSRASTRFDNATSIKDHTNEIQKIKAARQISGVLSEDVVDIANEHSYLGLRIPFLRPFCSYNHHSTHGEFLFGVPNLGDVDSTHAEAMESFAKEVGSDFAKDIARYAVMTQGTHMLYPGQVKDCIVSLLSPRTGPQYTVLVLKYTAAVEESGINVLANLDLIGGRKYGNAEAASRPTEVPRVERSAVDGIDIQCKLTIADIIAYTTELEQLTEEWQRHNEERNYKNSYVFDPENNHRELSPEILSQVVSKICATEDLNWQSSVNILPYLISNNVWSGFLKEECLVDSQSRELKRMTMIPSTVSKQDIQPPFPSSKTVESYCQALTKTMHDGYSEESFQKNLDALRRKPWNGTTQ